MNLWKVVKFFGEFGITIVRCTPELIMGMIQLQGIWCKKKFVIGDRIVVRPDHFNTRAHRVAFQDVGEYVSSPLTRVLMTTYEDSYLTSEQGLQPKWIPLSVWHEVLAFFAKEGIIVERWELWLPRQLKRPSRLQGEWDPYERDNLTIPQHTAEGDRVQPLKSNWIQGIEPDSSPFDPALMTSAQKKELVGKTYKLHSNERVLRGDDSDEEVVVKESDFRRLYCRRDELISEARKDRAAKALVKAIQKS
ncbi:hypothetical protein HYV70_02875 [Candidatus Uhrbacteria bacterium]|nr:hypothetical protein [Candidatus Uhrbacteria bacterium]